MEDIVSKSRLICPRSDPAQSMHFLSQDFSGAMSECFICNSDDMNDRYHLYCDTCDFDLHRECFFEPRCYMSDFTNPHTLKKLYDEDNFSSCFTCGDGDLRGTRSYYHCDTCNLDFHEVCHLYPPEIKHPFHPSHPLKLTFSENFSVSDLKHLPTSWQDEIADSETEPGESSDVDCMSKVRRCKCCQRYHSKSDLKCKCCQRPLQEAYYHCSVCNFSLNFTCTKNPPPLTVLNIKSHGHTLTVFPRQIPLPCDACGVSLNQSHDLAYACLPCNYMVHKTCIYLPRVIKITSHPHRLSLSPSLPSGEFHCGGCHLLIDVTCGNFSCTRGCHNAVHSRCAVGESVWDGKDQEGVPEEPDDDDDADPFVRIDESTIQHFSHAKHYLRLNKNDDLCDRNKFCQACCLLILASENFYSCIERDYILHEACAGLPRKISHRSHKHPLILHPIPPKPLLIRRTEMIEGMFTCNGCGQISNGFVYRCKEERCNFQLDVRCASLPDPFSHGSHPHELFFNLTQGECIGCKSSHCSPVSLECIKCNSHLGLRCATLPSVTHYEYDRHLLILCYGEECTRNREYWCEICETKLDPREWFYTCNDVCTVRVHVSCILGNLRFMKPMSFQVDGNVISILENNDSTRPICYRCDRRCQDPLLLESGNNYFCSFRCMSTVVLMY